MTDPNKTILLVDDDEDFLTQMQVQLTAAGYHVDTAGGRKEALERIEDGNKYDLAIVDLMMQEVDDGFALCHQIKRIDPAIPVIMVTAVTAETGMAFDASTSEERSWVKADAVLAKPVRFEQLEREIGRLLEV
ncbi:MAG: response regulator transcription factor [Phycisphaerae bacterium]